MKPCPFCMDKNPQWYGFGTRSDKIICPNCGAQTALMDKNLVVNAWDSRPIEDALRSALAAADFLVTHCLICPIRNCKNCIDYQDYLSAKKQAGV